ncbi:DedA family protein [Exiguobacterium sp. TRN 1102]|uniref:DedA family protein n=1 Tax=Exiguobacterium sp. TRN 1102 TaxID=3420732 RepID=UPI003D76BCAE
MEQWIQQIIEQFGYLGVMFLIFIENVFPPIPSELILIFGGFFTTTTTLNPLWMIVVATVGALLGAVVLYGIGLLLDRERLELLITRYGKRLYLKIEDVRMTNRWFDRFGPKLVFFGRFVPVVRSLISIPAGMSNMPFLQFIVLTTCGTLIWNTVLIFIGVVVGENWQVWLGYIEMYSHVMYMFLGFTILAVVGWTARIVLKRRSTH